MKKRTWLSWSSGKDSAWALGRLRDDPDIELLGLFSTINEQFERVSMHGVRKTLVERQAACLGLPIEIIPLPFPCTDAECDHIMARFTTDARERGIDCFAYGDLFLEGIRRYREERLAPTGISPLFPLWGSDTRALADQMVTSGLRARITSIDPKQLPAGLIGSDYDAAFLTALPPEVDPCGEHGEFHSFVYDGPMFAEPIDVTVGDTVTRDGFVYVDLI